MKYKILLVEDNSDIRENTSEILELNNYIVFTAANGKEGLAAALKKRPDIILCDIKMPVMDGYHLLQHIRQQPTLNNSIFIFFTASCEKKDIESAFKMGADEYIIKPFSGDQLLYKLKAILANKEGLLV